MSDSTDWPTSKLTPPADTSAQCAVLLATGAMNPLHGGHVAMLHAAAERLRCDGIHIVGAYLSPSHDGYVQPKASSLHCVGLSAMLRVELARRAVADDSLVEVGSWEACCPGRWPDFPVVCEACKTALRHAPGLRSVSRLRVYYVCGTDHASKCGLWTGQRAYGVVVVPRAGDAPRAESANTLVALPAPGDAAGFSSTAVRAALSRGDCTALSRMLAPACAQLLLSPSEAERAAFARDFAALGTPGARRAKGTPAHVGHDGDATPAEQPHPAATELAAA